MNIACCSAELFPISSVLQMHKAKQRVQNLNWEHRSRQDSNHRLNHSATTTLDGFIGNQRKFAWQQKCICIVVGLMDPLQLAVTWYKIRHAGEQAVHWDIRNKATSSRQICSFFVVDVPVRSLLSSMVDFVPCDR